MENARTSREWEEHALHPTKSPTGENEDTERPAAAAHENPDAEFGAETSSLRPGGGVAGSGTGGNPASQHRDDMPDITPGERV